MQGLLDVPLTLYSALDLGGGGGSSSSVQELKRAVACRALVAAVAVADLEAGGVRVVLGLCRVSGGWHRDFVA